MTIKITKVAKIKDITTRAVGFIPNLIKKTHRKEPTFLGHQRLLGFIFYSFIVILAASVALFSKTGPSAPLLIIINSFFLASAVITLFCYIRHKVNLVAALWIITMTTQIATSAEMIFAALHPTPYYMMLIMCDMALLSMNLLFSLLIYLKYCRVVLCIVSLAVYVACTIVAKSDIMFNLMPTFLIGFILIVILGNQMINNTRKLENENKEMHKSEEDMIRLLKVDKEELKAYSEISKDDLSVEETEGILEHMHAESRHNVIMNVNAVLRKQEIDNANIDHIFPELTPSEKEIVRLILQGKKLGEICATLDKKPSNINAQRAYIRKKLGLHPEDNLYMALQERMQAAQTEE